MKPPFLGGTPSSIGTGLCHWAEIFAGRGAEHGQHGWGGLARLGEVGPIVPRGTIGAGRGLRRPDPWHLGTGGLKLFHVEQFIYRVRYCSFWRGLLPLGTGLCTRGGGGGRMSLENALVKEWLIRPWFSSSPSLISPGSMFGYLVRSHAWRKRTRQAPIGTCLSKDAPSFSQWFWKTMSQSYLVLLRQPICQILRDLGNPRGGFARTLHERGPCIARVRDRPPDHASRECGSR